jgi:aspergillopepsin I
VFTSARLRPITNAFQDVFATGLSDGLLGLGFSNINQGNDFLMIMLKQYLISSTVRPTQVPTFMDNVASSLPEDVFTVDLKAGVPGSYDFGFIDPAKYVGEIAYAPVNSSRGYWGFNMDSFAIGAAAAPTPFSAASMYTIADTGTSINWLPTSLVTQYYNTISGAAYSDTWGGMTFPCDATLPDLTLYIGGQPRVMPGKFANYAPLNDGSGSCFGGIQDGSSSPGFSILGDTFLKSQFVVFDRKVPQLGFAAQI